MKAFAEKENTFFMETSALEALNIYRVVSKKALEARDDLTTALPRGQMIHVGSRDDGTRARAREEAYILKPQARNIESP
ncbi:hypothetical protein YC2023_055281 [Brassica napus]